VNVALIVATFTVWLFYELPNLDSAVAHSSFYPCAVDNACHAPQPWGISWVTAMFLHGGFVFGFIVTRVLVRAGRIAPQDGTGQLPTVD
jgi:membrane associated rhomboid family serine protease